MARAAHVSVSTASSALSGTGRVAPDTRERVRRTAEVLGYQPDQLARVVAKAERSELVAVVFDSLPDGPRKRDPKIFWEHAMYSISYELLRSQVSPILVPTVHHEHVRTLPIDVLLLITHDPGQLAHPIPINPGTRIVVGGLAQEDAVGQVNDVAAWISIDAPAIMSECLDYLRSQGSSAPAFLATPQPLSPIAAYEKAARDWFAHEGLPAHVEVGVPETESATRRLLANGADAIILLGDENHPDIDGVLKAIEAAGMSCPDDVLVISLTEAPRAPYVGPGITTMYSDGFTAGVRTAELLLAGLRGQGYRSVTLDHQLDVRGSTSRTTAGRCGPSEPLRN
ncbi:MAG: LacI family DNA-binding transcriptional regulator [Candidatus Nanopelagicales bacterium]